MTLLLLAGTGEAKAIATRLRKEGIAATASLAGASRAPAPLDIPTRSGGFGGEAAFRAYLSGHAITAVLDATHPFADRISQRTARVCAGLGIPYCQVLRPPWAPGPGDDWTLIDREEEAAAHIAPGATVFLATGRQTLHRFANLSSCTVISRQINVPDTPFPFPNGRFLPGTPPFSEGQEYDLFKSLGVDWLVAKNAGGPTPRTKLDAARRLGLRVALINRPPQPEARRVETVEDALAWVRSL
ncbi:cobalt-precorrin-6A reductase [Roseovarius atlanticus]|uniref:cobalt-precorrin-6A reductase n=1 Tax=Roseovarius atlanticus TaxID=1641875 RepID=UPI001C98DAC5|nr:cobalt-precorrin-6A reductase [Roseovarius atlanticus]MBY5988417.1 cobalt-precorrin-6A reductase [Roseovarius atlanticus]MBY6123808.1 cobalt-precorrin-6A reductase [Roseovarius atlanticus]MBY6148303.1 cobalt-precorrin-6A reductase [Roseovarius atlanticus]